MSTEDPRKPAKSPTDPRLKSFLRQAGAIISAEKGLTPTSRVKLQTLAARIKLPRPLFDEGLARLQSSPAALHELTRYEKAFIQFLNSEFEKLSGGVLSLGMEKNAIDLANRKYQINNARAEQLLQAQSDAAGISRISPDEAIVFAEQTILDQIGELATVDDEVQVKLHKIGKKWGLAPADIDRLISRRLTINRSQMSRGREKIAIAMLAAAVLLGGLWAAYAMGVFSESDPKPIATQPDTPADPRTFADTWLPGSALKKLESLSESNRHLNSCLEKLQDEDDAQRQQAYLQLVDASCISDSPDQEQINSLIGKLFFVEPSDEAALQITRRIHEILSPVSLKKSLSPSNLPMAYRANRILSQLLLSRRSLTPDSEAGSALRIQALEECTRSDVGISIKNEESIQDYISKSELAIATDQWNRLIQSSWRSPGNAAAVVEPLIDLTEPILNSEALNQYRDESVLSIMSKDSSRWRQLRDPITQSIKDCDEFGISEWIKVYSNVGDGASQDLIGELLLQRIDVKPKSPRRKDIAEAIEEYGTQYRYRVLRPVMDRSALIDKHYANLMEQESSESVLPDRISQMALAVNVELAFCAAIENATHLDDSSFPEFDRLIVLPAPRLRELISLPIDRRGAKPSASSSATASDERRKTASLERLADLAPDSSGRRILAVRQLERVAHRFERISYADAGVLADYFMADLGREELLECESRLDSFSHWPNLTLAIADKLPEKNIEVDQALTVTRLLTGREFESTGKPDWRTTLQLELLEAVGSALENQIDQDPNNIKSNWTRLKLYLNENYRQRRAIALNQAAGQAHSTPFQATLDLIDGLVETTAWRPSNRSLQRATSLVRQSPLNEIEKAVFANQLLIQFLSSELSESDDSTDIPPILSALQSSFRKSELPGEHLFATERTLFQLIDLKRKSLVDQLIKQN